MKKHILFKKRVCRVLAVMMIVGGSTYYRDTDTIAKPQNDSAYVNYGRKTSRVERTKKGEKQTTSTGQEKTISQTTKEATTVSKETTEWEPITDAVTTRSEITAIENEVTQKETTATENGSVQEETTATENGSVQEETTAAENGNVQEEATATENGAVQKETTSSQQEIASDENVKELETSDYTEEDRKIVQQENSQEQNTNTALLEKIDYYTVHLEDEAQWLWTQQLDNGALAFYNTENGSVYVNPYFSEIAAISLIKYDKSPQAHVKMRKYLEWHFGHLNTAMEDYNGIAGTIYDYDITVKNGEVISETSRGSYDSTDAYAALFLVALNEYVNSYGDSEYILKHKNEIAEVVNVIYATMAVNGYTYAKPDYKICYLMDNSEVYAGLVAARDLYINVIDDEEMLAKLTASVKHYEENFEKDWWKGDHYAATISKSTCSENSIFSWDNFYPCVTAQLFPVLFDLPVNEAHTKMVYDKIDEVIDWQNMEYVTNGTTVFYWCNFATYAAKLGKFDDLAVYMANYQNVIDGGRKYPLYSSESAKILEACDIIKKDLENAIS